MIKKIKLIKNKKKYSCFLVILMMASIFSTLSFNIETASASTLSSNIETASARSKDQDTPSNGVQKHAIIMVGRYYGGSLINTLKDPDSTIQDICSAVQETYEDFSREAARMYRTLRDDHGYDEENIYLFFRKLPPSFTVDSTFNTGWRMYDSNKVLLKNRLTTLGNTMDEDDSLFFCFIDHGVTEQGTNKTYFGCPYPSIPLRLWSIFGTSKPFKLYDSDLANYVSSISGNMIFALHPCHSGGFIDDLSGDKRVILTSAKYDERDDGWIGGFLDALDVYNEDGTPYYDYNGDGRVSMYEAYCRGAIYLETSGKTQHPLIDDNGDDQGSNFHEEGFNENVIPSPGNDGYIASQTFIDEEPEEPDVETPDVETLDVNDDFITENSAKIEGKINDDGGQQCGCYLIVIGSGYYYCGTYSSGQEFSHTFTGLETDTTYTYFALAYNDAGTNSGMQKQFTTSTTQTNNIPILTDTSVSPGIGSIDTTFVYQVTYYDEDGDIPTVNDVYIDNVRQDMSRYYSSGGGSSPYYGIYRYQTTLSEEGDHSYSFEFNDGHGHTVVSPSSGGSYSGPSVSVNNQPPSLKSGYVTPTSGDDSEVFTYWVTYSDPDGDSPATRRVRIYDGSEYSSHSMTPSSSYTSGDILYRRYKYQTTFSDDGSYEYSFEFSDGHGHTVLYPSSGGSYSGPSVSTSSPNQPPILSSPSVSPTSGSTSTTFVYKIKYTDPEGDAPTVYKVYIDNLPYTMTKTSGTYSSGAWYEYSTTTLSDDSHHYYFKFNDGHHSANVNSPTYSGPTVTQTNNWIRPDGYVSNKWDYEYRARDNDPTDSTYAKYDKVDLGCCNDALILTYSSPITIDRLKINAKYHDKMYKMEIQLFLNGNQQGSTKVINSWPDNGDKMIFVGDMEIDKVKIWFTLETGRSFSTYPAKVYDFECRTT